MRKSIAYLKLTGKAAEGDELSLYGHTFIDDIRNGVVPYDGMSRSMPRITVSLTPSSSDDEEVIRFAFPHQGYIGHNLKDTVTSYIRQCATELGYWGQSFHEIVRGDDLHFLHGAHRQPRVAIDRLFRPELIPGRVLHIGGYFIQLVPQRDLSPEHPWYPIISARDVWQLTLPREFGTWQKHRRRLGNLQQASRPLPKFVMEAMEKRAGFADFNSLAYHNSQNALVAHETASWGWAGRGGWDKYALEYFTVYRHLRFARSMAILRVHILTAINFLLERMGLLSRISLSGAPTVEDIDSIIEALRRGENTFGAALRVLGLEA